MVKVGLRSSNWPDEEEKAILIHHVITNFGGNTIKEINLAFDMAIAGKLGIDANCYENFSCLYFSTVMNAYRAWAKLEYEHLREKKPLPSAVQYGIDWRELVQTALNLYLTSKYEFRLMPIEIYDQLVYDDFIHPLNYISFEQTAKQYLCSQVQRDLTAFAMMPHQDIDKCDIGQYKDHQRLEKKLIQYRNGTRDAEIKLLAKQMAVKHYFFHLKTMGTTKIYKNEGSAS